MLSARMVSCALLLVLVTLAACSQEPAPVDRRLVILGFDGMDPELASLWMDEGALPNFADLREKGDFRPLATSNPPQSPVAWSDFATGSTPGNHGIYDFLRRDPETYLPAFSISESIPPSEFLELFGMKLPLDDGAIVNRRIGTPFWLDLEAHGGRSTVLRVPVTFPPDPVHRMFSGMGVPDLLGTQGTYTMYATHPLASGSTASSRVVRVRPNRQGHIETVLEGPVHPLKPDEGAMQIPMTFDPVDAGARVTIGDATMELREGEWSDWVEVEFSYFGPAAVGGIVQLLLVKNYPRLEIYVSPIHIDPRSPVVPLTSPPDYAAELVEHIGLYHTIGMPEETWSLNENHIDDHAWLALVRQTLAEREAMLFDALDRKDSDVVTAVFVQTDRVSHMFYRGIDPQHPLHVQTGEEARGAIKWIYREADRILGETMSRLGPRDELMVISDHGFAPFRRAVNLNRWLADHGYLVLKDGHSESPAGFVRVDWQRSRAYALGLNSIFLNRSGRESNGVVSDEEAPKIKQAIMQELATLRDAKDGSGVVEEVFDGARLYPGNANDDAPDLVVGYAPGFRASWQTTLGGVPPELIEDNARKWSGDHCMTPDAVPGVLFTSFKAPAEIASISDIAGYVRDHWVPGGRATGQ